MIDREMKLAGLKAGPPAGYLLWEKVEVKMSDFRYCAVHLPNMLTIVRVLRQLGRRFGGASHPPIQELFEVAMEPLKAARPACPGNTSSDTSW